MLGELISITLDDQDEPVLSFTHNPEAPQLEQKLLGALLRKARPNGILQVHLVKTYGESDEKPLYDYHIRISRDDD